MAPARSQGPGTTFLASLSSDEAQANRPSAQPAISSDGRWVAFTSAASTLVAEDTNGVEDVFVRDTVEGTTVRVSLSTDGDEGNDRSRQPSISSDGRFVAFASLAENLLGTCGEFPCDINGSEDVFVRDRDADANGVFDEAGGVATVIISVSDDGRQEGEDSFEPDISADGRVVAFTSETDADFNEGGDADRDDVFIRDRDTDVDGIHDEPGVVDTELVSRASAGAPGNRDSLDPAVSADGRFVAFTSFATNLVVGPNNLCDEAEGGDSAGNCPDVFLRDRTAAVTSLISRANSGGAGNPGNAASVQPTIDAAGRYVAFASDANNLLTSGTDTGDVRHVFIRDRSAPTTTLASVNSNGVQANGPSFDPDITADGRYIGFGSVASNLRRGDTNRAQDVFIRDQFVVKQDGIQGRTNRVSVSAEGDETPPRSVSRTPAASDDGQFVAFESTATNLVGQDSDEDGACDVGCDRNEFADVFVRDRQPTVDIDPIPVLFDTQLVTDTSPEQLVTVSNEGDGPMTIATVQLLGPGNPGDFAISTDGCTGRRLHPEERCFVGVRFRPAAPGTRSAFFAVSKLRSLTPDATALMLGGGFQPVVAVSPNIGPPGFVASVDGILFPPSRTILLTWKPGLGQVELESDADGNIAGQILIFHNDITGPRLLRARGPGVRAEADFMVTVATGQPPKFVNR